jgi:tetratricopeptide (TPR) repeat protein
MGKTSLARAIAGDCLTGANGAPCVAAVVWVSDRNHPGTTNLSTTLDEIARVLDYPGLAALPFVERQRAIEDLLRRGMALLVIDNADTITDQALFEWLTLVPGPSKALVTSRFKLPSLQSSYLIELGPLAAHESQALIAEWAPRSRLRSVPGVIDDLAPIAEATGGNAKAIELALGLLQYRARDAVIDDIRTSRADLFDGLFAHAWDLLDGAARHVLLALPLFPTSASAEALAYCANLTMATFQRSIERLSALSLIDIEQRDLRAAPRYNAHPLVRAYAYRKSAELPIHARVAFQERWLTWCVELAASVGFCWDDLDRLDALDDDYATIQAAMTWAEAQGHDAALIALIEGVRYYTNVRGLWGVEELRTYERYAAAARRLGDTDYETLAIARHVQVLSKQGQIVAAAALIERLRELGATYRSVALADGDVVEATDDVARRDRRNDAAFEFGHALALFARAQGALAIAEAHWRDLLTLSRRLGGQKYVVNRRWLATALLQQGRHADAQQLYTESLHDARLINDIRSIAGNRLKLASIALDGGDIPAVTAAIDECRVIAQRYRDRRRLAECHRITAHILSLQGDVEAATYELRAALDLFERLGMKHEATAAQAELATLEALHRAV